MAAIVAGSKVSTKLDVLNSLSQICNQLIVGGGIANTFLAAAGHPVGKSLYEPATMAAIDWAGAPSALPSASNSAASNGPAAATLANLATPWVEPSAR